MKNLILIGCLIGSIYAVSGDSAQIALTEFTGAAPAPSSEAVVRPAADQSNASLAVLPDTEQSAEREQPAAERELPLLTVNRVSLYDDQAAVVRKLGAPESITGDPHLSGSETYRYPDVNVYFYDGFVDFVEIPEGAEAVLIDDVLLPATLQHLKDALGEPDYVTEDGIVYERDEALLKLFFDAGTERLTSITYFHRASM
ncbi:hypothetical protein KP806_13240 [Paenibacillus sp. N4]|uniref:hypothetical protein n=1 Tax=Paenibacillus vietnamensis TaxID=2590547 RepID=UPI001CD10DDD|nr:hypothetical protein [Paenibacillus vietnamensis]MCA0756015.1 hypothetical protein [Paenibacillus vietnamensis]